MDLNIDAPVVGEGIQSRPLAVVSPHKDVTIWTNKLLLVGFQPIYSRWILSLKHDLNQRLTMSSIKWSTI